MAKFAIAKQLTGKRLVTNDGEEIGKLIDIYVSESTGKIEAVIIEPNPDNGTARRLKREGGVVSIPYSAVLAVSDHIIVDKKGI
ncbi:PRC-barrel domain protein [Candidatus Burarchaeum australiense]|nr:PRC-barrel domain protein [Candidatus Burarchaeum australiense]